MIMISSFYVKQTDKQTDKIDQQVRINLSLQGVHSASNSKDYYSL